MNFSIFKRMIRDPRLTPAHKVVGCVLLDRANRVGACWPRAECIAVESSLSLRTVAAACSALAKLKYITIQNIMPGEMLPGGHRAYSGCTVYHVGHLEKFSANFSAPCHDPTKIPKIRNNKHCKAKLGDDLDKTLKSNRWNELMSLFKTITFTTKNGTKETVFDNVADPAAVCDYLASDRFAALSLRDEMEAASAWTAEHRKNRRDRLGAFLRNWFQTAARRAPQPRNCEVKPRYHEPL